MEKRIIKVTGMDCTGCEDSISKALKRLQGVANCSASFTDAKVEVEFDSGQVGLVAIWEAIADAGYEVVATA
ncbi:MAG: heavy-metal-associated domain-containing protein [Actinomycetota bacterium]